MKGPGFRLDLDPRRMWECSACGRRLKMPGNVTQMTCDCQGEKFPSMRLVEGLRRTDSPFDHVGYAAQKRIDAAIKRPAEEDGAEQEAAEQEPGLETIAPVESPAQPDAAPGSNPVEPAQIVEPAAVETEGVEVNEASVEVTDRE